MPSLRELEGVFRKLLPDGCSQIVENLADADGIMFLCPKCLKEIGSNVGCHWVLCWFVGKVPDDLDPKPGRWMPSGTSMDDLTFVPGKPERAVSVLLTSGCGWHGHVENGRAN